MRLDMLVFRLLACEQLKESKVKVAGLCQVVLLHVFALLIQFLLLLLAGDLLLLLLLLKQVVLFGLGRDPLDDLTQFFARNGGPRGGRLVSERVLRVLVIAGRAVFRVAHKRRGFACVRVARAEALRVME